MKSKTTAIVAEYKKLSDEELVYRYVHRHENIAFDFLFERYGHLVLGIFMKHFKPTIAKEKTEAFFVELMEGVKKFHIDDNFGLWLYNYVNKQCLPETKKTPLNAQNALSIGGMSFTGSDVSPEELKVIEETLATLNKTERECIEAFYLNNKNYLQIAREKKLTITQTKQYIQAGLQTIKNKNEALKHVKP